MREYAHLYTHPQLTQHGSIWQDVDSNLLVPRLIIRVIVVMFKYAQNAVLVLLQITICSPGTLT